MIYGFQPLIVKEILVIFTGINIENNKNGIEICSSLILCDSFIPGRKVKTHLFWEGNNGKENVFNKQKINK
jgi:hypothetical protein